jgi:predicted transcriptional regulator of viral defense system
VGHVDIDARYALNRNRVLAVVEEAGTIDVRDVILELVGMSEAVVRKNLIRLAASGDIHRVYRGRYSVTK